MSDEGPREESEPELFEEEDTEVVSEDLSEFGDESALDEPALDEGAIGEREEAGAEGESEDSEGAPAVAADVDVAAAVDRATAVSVARAKSERPVDRASLVPPSRATCPTSLMTTTRRMMRTWTKIPAT